MESQPRNMRLDKIRRIHVEGYISKRQRQGASARTVNLEISVFRSVLNRTIDADLISSLPAGNRRPLKVRKRERPLVDTEDIEKLCAVGFTPSFVGDRLAKEHEQGRPLLNAQEFSDYIRLMCYSGARMSEALGLRYADVRWQN